MKAHYLLVLCIICIAFTTSCTNRQNEEKADTTSKVDTIKNATASSQKHESTTDQVLNTAKTLLKNVKGCYTPSFVPVKFCLNAQGKFTVSSAQKFVFALGSIDLSSSATFTVPDNKLIVQINMPEKSYFYEIKRDEQLKINIDGKAFLAIENHRIVIDAEKNKNLAIVFENAEKPTTKANDAFLNQFLGITKGMGVGQVVKKFETGYDIKRAAINEDFAAYEFRKPAKNLQNVVLPAQKDSTKSETNSDTLRKRPPVLLSLVYRRASGEIIAILANKKQSDASDTDIFSLAKSRNIVDYKVNLFRAVRGDIKTYLSNYESINESKESVTFIVPCNYSCFPKLTFITREENLYRCSRVLLYFEKVGDQIQKYLGSF